ncbi:hypothetical protein ALQ08_200294 [Pseudomonas syringae pv. delphinii]|uniref:Uncharacterized protein n=1 Tax=Pseudomonas syringae pv. delphinii TaxID=192088 RepID=A0A0P9QBE3_9PSED|nr:hypothetical protein ALO72_200260 [Pseudomonas syringae pv. delphinii]RMP09419.1 hypothetical protein ALQ28_200043 [Pseudomonas syringae pv. delphinii]RMP23076.1 hypothetical protein ALQ27_200022 [Pseudomonas syringae pv. delphinii]RMQ20683.1 hypothetical protein ALQ08_200294 [Pseudomonas syringae pv. delphinii]
MSLIILEFAKAYIARSADIRLFSEASIEL